MVKRVYLLTKRGVEIHFRENAKEIIESIEKDGEFPYTFYAKGTPVYVAVQNGSIGPLIFPNPGAEDKNYGITSPELYAKAVTYAEAATRIIQIQTRSKPSLMDQMKKVMTLATPIVAVAFIIFIMAVALKG